MKFRSVLTFLILSILTIQTTHAMILSSCSALLTTVAQRLFIPQEDVTQLTEEVEVFWYPRSFIFNATHTKLSTQPDVWNLYRGFALETTAKRAKWVAQRSNKGFFSFHIRVSEEEKIRIEEYLKANIDHPSEDHCLTGINSTLDKCSEFSIPFPFYHSPLLTVIYLTLSKTIGKNARIASIEYIGKNAFLNVLSFSVTWELGFISYLEYLLLGAAVNSSTFAVLVSYLNEAGDVVQLLVPVLQ